MNSDGCILSNHPAFEYYNYDAEHNNFPLSLGKNNVHDSLGYSIVTQLQGDWSPHGVPITKDSILEPYQSRFLWNWKLSYAQAGQAVQWSLWNRL